MKSQKKSPRLAATIAAAVMFASLLGAVTPAQRQRRRQPSRATPSSRTRPPSSRATPSTTRATTPLPSGTTPPPPAAAASPTPRAEGQPAQPPQGESDKPIEELISSDSYAVFAEVRRLGQLTQSKEAQMALESLRLLGDAPKELNSVVRFMTVHAETLSESRLVLSAGAARPEVPAVLVALQLSSPESARIFEPKLRAFVAAQAQSLLPQLPPETTEAPARRGGRRRSSSSAANGRPPTALPFVIKRAGSWLLASDESFTLKRLRGDGTKMLADNARLQAVRGRFTSEPIFVYVDTALAEQSSRVAMEKAAREAEKNAQDSVPVVVGVNPRSDDEELATVVPTPDLPPVPTSSEVAKEGAPIETPTPETAETSPTVTSDRTVARVTTDPTPEAPPPMDEAAQSVLALASLFERGIGGGITRMPKAVGVAIGFEGDAVTIHALVANPPGEPVSVIPFLPNIVSGPAIAPESPSFAPADSDIFASATLDWTQIYALLMQSANTPAPPEMVWSDEEGKMIESPENTDRQQPNADKTVEAIEKLFNFKIKDDLLPALGSEIALSLPLSEIVSTGAKLNPTKEWESKEGENKEEADKQKDTRAGIVVYISLNNPDTLRNLLPRVLAAFGFASRGAVAETEKREGFEIHNYGGFSYVIINNFLAVAQTSAALRHVVDAYSTQQTLASVNGFRDATAWQPRQKLAQVYVADSLTRYWIKDVKERSSESIDPAVLLLRAQLDFPPDAPTYVVTSEGEDLLHELRLPVGIIKAYAAAFIIGIKEMPVTVNESSASFALRAIASGQNAYKELKDEGRYGTFEELVAAGMIEKSFLENKEYKIELRVSGDKFEATATPLNYGKTGRRSFFVDQSGVIRGANHKGEPATVADPPVD